MEKVQLEIEVKGSDSVGKASEKTKSLKAQLKELKTELQSGKLTGKAFDKATLKAAKMQEKIDDVNQSVKALANDNIELAINGFNGLTQGIVGGFAAAKGAMALFGGENEDLRKQMVKLQGAVALLNGVESINLALKKESGLVTGLNATRLKLLTFAQTRYTAAVGTTTGAMKILRLVGMTLGIGIIVAAIGLLVANFDKLKDITMNVVNRFKNLGSGTKNLISVMFPIIGIIRLVHAGLEKMGVFTETAKDRYEKLEKSVNKQNKALEREISLMEAQGKSAREIFEAKAQLIKSENDLLIAKSKVMKLTEEELEKNKDLVNQMKILNAEELNRQREENKKKQDEINKENEEAAKKRKENNDRLKAEKEKREKEEKEALANHEKQMRDLRKESFEESFKRTLSEQEKELLAINDNYRSKLELAINDANLTKILEEQKAKDKQDIIDKYAAIEKEKSDKDKEEKLAIEKEYAEKVVEVNRAIEDSKIAIAEQSADFIQQVAGQNKALSIAAIAIEKGAAIASVIINTQREISGYYAAASARSVFSAGATTAADQALALKQSIFAKTRAGLSIATIAATGVNQARQVSSGGGGGGGGASSGVTAPSIGGVNTGQGNTNNKEQIKVYVTETDIRRTMKKVDNIYTQATIE